MAINENVLGQVRPSESAVDRLRKRNRIRPWESGLVGAQTDPKSQPNGLGNPPPGQSTQGVDEPDGTRPPGFHTSGVNNPVSGSPSGPSAPEVNCPVGIESDRACADLSSLPKEAPTGHGTQRTRPPEGRSPSGSVAQVTKPTGQKTPEAINPLGELPKNTSTAFPNCSGLQ
jgi:hypothetical protein